MWLYIYCIYCISRKKRYEGQVNYQFSKSDQSRDLKHRGDKSWDLSSFTMKNPIFQQSIVNISGSLEFKFLNFCNFHLPLHLFPVVIFDYLPWDLQKSLVIVALRSTINSYTAFVSQVSWRKIRIVSGFIVLIIYAVTSRRIQESNGKAHVKLLVS